ETLPSGVPSPPRAEESTPPPAAALPQSSPGQDLLNRGRSLLLQGKSSAALVLLAQAVAATPADPEARYAYAQALWQTDSRAEALGQYQEAARLAPRNVSYRRGLGQGLAPRRP